MVRERTAGHVPTPPTARDREVRARFLRYSLVMARYLPERIDAPVVYFSADYTSRAGATWAPASRATTCSAATTAA